MRVRTISAVTDLDHELWWEQIICPSCGTITNCQFPLPTSYCTSTKQRHIHVTCGRYISATRVRDISLYVTNVRAPPLPIPEVFLLCSADGRQTIYIPTNNCKIYMIFYYLFWISLISIRGGRHPLMSWHGPNIEYHHYQNFSNLIWKSDHFGYYHLTFLIFWYCTRAAWVASVLHW